MKPKIIALAGPIRAGKTTAARYLAEKYGYVLATNSDVLKEIASKLELAHTRDNLAKLGNAIFESLGNDAIARHRVSQSKHTALVVDGLRYLEEVYTYRTVANFKLLALQSSQNDRYLRMRSLAQDIKDGMLTEAQFSAISLSRSERYVPDVMALADATLTNEGALDDLKRDIDNVLLSWTTANN